jgi:hypothetical protein
MKQGFLAAVAGLLICSHALAQFRDDFNAVKIDPTGAAGWRFRTGDGTATMDFRQGGKGHASVLVDARSDKRGIWWAFIQREVSRDMDLSLLRKPGHEVRIETRIRVSHAPRRVNLQVQTQRTTDYHSHLMEFDISDSDRWHTISMTTHDFDAGPGDTLIGHMALMDWGQSTYQVDVDYMKVDIVNVATAGPDQGAAVPYHPPLAEPTTFSHEVKAAHDSMIDLLHTDVNLNDWSIRDEDRAVRVLTVDGTHLVILRWDFSAFAGKTVAGSGLLELTTYSLAGKAEEVKDFGLLRVVEIISGDPEWDQSTVTTDSLLKNEELDSVLNPQMIIDWPAAAGDGSKTWLTISRPVLQRLIDGKTRGIAIKALGAVNASFYSRENDGGKRSARLRFNLK